MGRIMFLELVEDDEDTAVEDDEDTAVEDDEDTAVEDDEDTAVEDEEPRRFSALVTLITYDSRIHEYVRLR